MIKGILFDFDGTLSNRVESAYFMYRWMVHEMLPEMDVHDIEFERIVTTLYVMGRIRDNQQDSCPRNVEKTLCT